MAKPIVRPHGEKEKALEWKAKTDTLVVALPSAGHRTKPLTPGSLNLLMFKTRLKIFYIPCLIESL